MSALPGDLFARRLRQERERLGVSQAELARRMTTRLGNNVESTAITRIEQQTRAVRLDEAVIAADSLGIPLLALLTEDFARANEEEIQTQLAELALAEQAWEKQRQEVSRITRVIQTLSAERRAMEAYVDEKNPAPKDEPGMDPELKDAIDSRVPDTSRRFGAPSTPPVTGPGA